MKLLESIDSKITKDKNVVPNKQFGSLLDISPKNHIFSKHLNQNFKKSKYDLHVKMENH